MLIKVLFKSIFTYQEGFKLPSFKFNNKIH